MLTDMPCEKGLNFRFFDHRTNKQWFKGYWALARIIRRRVKRGVAFSTNGGTTAVVGGRNRSVFMGFLVPPPHGT